MSSGFAHFQRSIDFDFGMSSTGKDSTPSGFPDEPELVFCDQLDVSSQAAAVLAKLEGPSKKGILLNDRTSVESISPASQPLEGVFVYDSKAARTGIVFVVHDVSVDFMKIRMLFENLFSLHSELRERGEIAESAYQSPSNLYVVTDGKDRGRGMKARQKVRKAWASIQETHPNNPRLRGFAWEGGKKNEFRTVKYPSGSYPYNEDAYCFVSHANIATFGDLIGGPEASIF